MRYFFHAIGTKFINEDENGEEFNNDEDAIEKGAIIAKELSEDSTLDIKYIVVVDEEKREIARSNSQKSASAISLDRF
jgi:hypothetical protein